MCNTVFHSCEPFFVDLFLQSFSVFPFFALSRAHFTLRHMTRTSSPPAALSLPTPSPPPPPSSFLFSTAPQGAKIAPSSCPAAVESGVLFIPAPSPNVIAHLFPPPRFFPTLFSHLCDLYTRNPPVLRALPFPSSICLFLVAAAHLSPPHTSGPVRCATDLTDSICDAIYTHTVNPNTSRRRHFLRFLSGIYFSPNPSRLAHITTNCLLLICFPPLSSLLTNRPFRL